MQEVTEKVDNLEKIIRDLAYEQMQTQMSIRELTNDLQIFKEEMKDFKEEIKDFKNETDRNIKQMNKKWGELANKMGTFAEDIVAPNVPYIAKKYFGCDEFESFTVRSERQNTKKPSQRREFDAIAVYNNMVFLNETKSTPRIEYINDFIQFYKNNTFFEYFPEYQKKKLVPIFSSMYLSKDRVDLLSKNKIYAMAMTEGTMDLVNYEDIVK